jgi:hypothetical protein
MENVLQILGRLMNEKPISSKENKDEKNSIYNDVKNGKPYKRWDILIYLLLAVIIAVVFLSVYLFKNQKPGCTGVEFLYKDQVILVFNFDGSYEEKDGYTGTLEVEKRTDDIYHVTFYFEGNFDKFAKVKISLEEKSCDVLFSNCSNTKDCVYTPEIKDGVGAIVCVPFDFKILPINGEVPLVTG